MRHLLLATATVGVLTGLAGGAQAIEAKIPAPYNPKMDFTGPVVANIHTRTDVLPQGRPWFPSLGTNYGTFVDPWFPPVGTVIVRPVNGVIRK
jgi:hypothetical protein